MDNIDIEAAAKAIEDDAGEAIVDLRQALIEAKVIAEQVTESRQLRVAVIEGESGSTARQA